MDPPPNFLPGSLIDVSIIAGQAWECEPMISLAKYQRAKTGALFAAAAFGDDGKPYVQATDTFVTELVNTTPVPFVTVQVSPVGCVITVTVNAVSAGTGVGNVKVVAPDGGLTVALPLASTKPAAVKPLIVPPTVKVAGTQSTATLDTLALPTVPEPLVTVQTRPSGCSCTVTS
jgi:hypothetical protein